MSEFGFCQKIQQYDVKITFKYVTVSIIGNDEYIILCKFGDRIMSGLEVKEGALRSAPGRRKQTKARCE